MRRTPYRLSLSPEEKLAAVNKLLAGQPLADVAYDLNVTQRLLRTETDVLLESERERRNRPKAWIFLSHAHEDSDLALGLAEYIESRLGPQLAVFCTSRLQHRIEVAPERDSVSDGLLEDALSDRIADSLGVLLLVTDSAATKHSAWIEFEIDHAYRRMTEVEAAPYSGNSSVSELPPFWLIPCVAGDDKVVRKLEASLERGIFRIKDTTDVAAISHRRSLFVLRWIDLSCPEDLNCFITRLAGKVGITPHGTPLRSPDWWKRYLRAPSPKD